VDVQCSSVGIVNGIGAVLCIIGDDVGIGVNWVAIKVDVGEPSTAVDGWCKVCTGAS
jgi:hypothetical protein